MATVRIVQVKSSIGYRRDQRQTLRGLGLRRMGSKSELEDTPAVRGMIHKVSHLVRIQESE